MQDADIVTHLVVHITGLLQGGERRDVVATGDSSTAVSLRQVSLQRIDALFAEPPTADSAWLAQVCAELTLWQILYRAAQGLTTPAELQAFHVQYLGALELLDGAVVVSSMPSRWVIRTS